MKFSLKTLQILKNLSNINQSMLFKVGNKLRVLSESKDILADVVIDENIPVEFGVYDMNRFLSVISLHKDSQPILDFDASNILIKSDDNRSVIKYRFCDKNMILMPPEKDINMNDAEINFHIMEEDLSWILKTSNILGCPNISFSAKDCKLVINTLDVKDNSVSTNSLQLSDYDDKEFNVIFKTEKIQKLFPGNYNISISSKGISKFEHTELSLVYFIAIEDGSEYDE